MSAYDEGWEAARKGMQLIQNDYTHGTSLYYAWRRGWFAYKESTGAKRSTL